MPAHEPTWWYDPAPRWQTTALAPLAFVYGAVAVRRHKSATPYRSSLPVICVGNFTAGGTGKTPMSLAVARIVRELGAEPWFLSRGYGGRLDGQERVDPARHAAAEVGDEPLLLAAHAPTVISRDRRLGAEFIARQNPGNAVIIMDDGLQNPALFKDLSIAVVDAKRGLGNGDVIPAGPLRAPMAFQMSLADVIVINGTDGKAARQLGDIKGPASPVLLSAHTVPRSDTTWLNGATIVAYAGIANPSRFFEMLESLGARVVERLTFADHQTLSTADAARLLDLAQERGAQLVTTEKDFARLAGLGDSRAALRDASKTLPIAIQLPANDAVILKDKIAKMLASLR